MDPELKAYLDEIREDLAALKLGQSELREDVNAVKLSQRELREGQTDIVKRLDEGFAARKEDEDLALREIRAVKRRVTSLERRIKLIESSRQ